MILDFVNFETLRGGKNSALYFFKQIEGVVKSKVSKPDGIADSN
jgi:hypothetical protein